MIKLIIILPKINVKHQILINSFRLTANKTLVYFLSKGGKRRFTILHPTAAQYLVKESSGELGGALFKLAVLLSYFTSLWFYRIHVAIGMVVIVIEKYRYIEQIFRNVEAVDVDAVKQFNDILLESDLIIPYGSGRSYSALKIAMSQYAKIEGAPAIITPEDTGFPGNNMYEALETLTKKYERITMIVNSGSGMSFEPYVLASDFTKFIEERGGKSRLKLVTVTSNIDSRLGRLGRDYGLTIHLKGADRVAIDYPTTGIMGDVFELGSLLLFHTLVKMRYLRSSDYNKILNQYIERISRILEEHVESPDYEGVLDILERRSNVFIGGRGSAYEVATMLVIRLNHIKYAIGDHVYRARGSNTPRPRRGDLGILISCSGETPAVIKWADDFKEIGIDVFALIGRRGSTLEGRANYKIVLTDCEDYRPGIPRDFYLYASFLLSPLPIKLITRLKERGLVLPESILKYYHSIME